LALMIWLDSNYRLFTTLWWCWVETFAFVTQYMLGIKWNVGFHCCALGSTKLIALWKFARGLLITVFVP
jgi:hypothetical protein